MSILFLCGSILIGTSLPSGYNMGNVGPLYSILEKWMKETIFNQYGVLLNEYMLKMLWASVVSIYMVGAAIGSFGGAWLSDSFGRKRSIFVILMLFIVGSVMCFLCRLIGMVEILFVGKIIAGLAAGLCTSIVPMYLSEIAPLQLRSSLGVLFAVGFGLGVFVVNICNTVEVFGTDELWHYDMGFAIIFVLICLIAYPSFPESPKYLYIIAGNKQMAIAILTKLRGSNTAAIEEELASMEKEANVKTQSRSLISVIKDSKLRLPLLLTCFMQIGQQLSGITPISFYIVPLFEGVGLSTRYARWCNAALSLINIILALLTAAILTKVNRRPMMVASCFSLSISLLLMSIVLSAYSSWTAVLSIGTTFLFICGYQMGVGTMTYFIGSELFEVAPRPAAMALGSICSWTTSFSSAITFPSLNMALGSYVLVPYIIVDILLGIFLLYYLPETRNRAPAEIAATISKGFKSRPLKI